jgi:hypothetical protein
MKNDSDTAIAIEFKKQLVKQKQSIEICKECQFLIIKSKKPTCTSTNLQKETCNLLKIYM